MRLSQNRNKFNTKCSIYSYRYWIYFPFFIGDLIEKGIVRRLPEDFDGNKSPYVFTWSREIPNKTWAMASGCAPYYNTCKEGTSNTKMVRDFENDTFEIYAVTDIAKDEELLHTYISLKWRKCFSDLNDIIHADEK